MELKIESGEIKEEKTVPPLKGTTFLVEDLFYNTPARLKFVRTLQTELAHITDVVSKASLSHPEIAFVLKNDGNLLLQTSGKGDLLQAVAGNIGPVNARKMLPFYGEDEDFKVSGYTSLPELHVRTAITYRFSLMDDQSAIWQSQRPLHSDTAQPFNGGTIPDYDYFD